MTVNITLNDDEVEWLLTTLGLVMKLSRQWDNLRGDDNGQRLVNRLMVAHVIASDGPTDGVAPDA